jgi:hypothetical protein
MMKKLLLFCLLSPVFRDDVAPGWYLAAEKSGALACVGLAGAHRCGTRVPAYLFSPT